MKHDRYTPQIASYIFRTSQIKMIEEKFHHFRMNGSYFEIKTFNGFKFVCFSFE